jgi:hypothetical protein
MKDGKINTKEYIIVSNCVLAMWIDKYLKDGEYYIIIDKLNDYAKKCGISDKADGRNSI